MSSQEHQRSTSNVQEIFSQDCDITDTSFFSFPKVSKSLALDDLRGRIVRIIPGGGLGASDVVQEIAETELGGKPSRHYKDLVKRAVYSYLKEMLDLMPKALEKMDENQKIYTENAALAFAFNTEFIFARALQAANIAGGSYELLKNNQEMDEKLKSVLAILVTYNADRIKHPHAEKDASVRDLSMHFQEGACRLKGALSVDTVTAPIKERFCDISAGLKSLLFKISAACSNLSYDDAVMDHNGAELDSRDDLLHEFLSALEAGKYRERAPSLTTALKAIGDIKLNALASFCSSLLADPKRPPGAFDEQRLNFLNTCHYASEHHTTISRLAIFSDEPGLKALQSYQRYLDGVYERGVKFMEAFKSGLLTL